MAAGGAATRSTLRCFMMRSSTSEPWTDVDY
jgi:hypothetical protein